MPKDSSKVDKLNEVSELKTVEEWKALKLKTPEDPRYWYLSEDWMFQSAKQKFKWVVNEVLSEKQFDECIEAAKNHSYKG